MLLQWVDAGLLENSVGNCDQNSIVLFSNDGKVSGVILSFIIHMKYSIHPVLNAVSFRIYLLYCKILEVRGIKIWRF